MAVLKKPKDEIENNQVLGLLHLQSTPRKAAVVTWGYDLGTSSGRRDNCATLLLALLLVVIAITVSPAPSGLFGSCNVLRFRVFVCSYDICWPWRDVYCSTSPVVFRSGCGCLRVVLSQLSRHVTLGVVCEPIHEWDGPCCM